MAVWTQEMLDKAVRLQERIEAFQDKLEKFNASTPEEIVKRNALRERMRILTEQIKIDLESNPKLPIQM